MGYSQDKRHYVRVEEYAPAYCKIIKSKESHHKLSKDVSEGGIRLLGDKFIPVNSLVRLEVFLDRGHNRLIDTAGRIVWVRKSGRGELYEFGIIFESLSYEDKKHLREFVIRKIRIYIPP